MFLHLAQFSSLIPPKGNLTTLRDGYNGIKIAENRSFHPDSQTDDGWVSGEEEKVSLRLRVIEESSQKAQARRRVSQAAGC